MTRVGLAQNDVLTQFDLKAQIFGVNVEFFILFREHKNNPKTFGGYLRTIFRKPFCEFSFQDWGQTDKSKSSILEVPSSSRSSITTVLMMTNNYWLMITHYRYIRQRLINGWYHSNNHSMSISLTTRFPLITSCSILIGQIGEDHLQDEYPRNGLNMHMF